jgi:uncharacterized protein YggT (Ycf19 family)
MAGLLSVIVGIIQLLVGSRFVLLLLGVDPTNSIVDWIYHVSAPLVAPFNHIFNQSAVLTQGISVESVFEIASLLALLVYGIVGSLLVRALSNTFHRTYHA